MVVVQGFASVNTDGPVSQPEAQTLEAQEARVLNLFESTLSLTQAQRYDEAEVAALLLKF